MVSFQSPEQNGVMFLSLDLLGSMRTGFDDAAVRAIAVIAVYACHFCSSCSILHTFCVEPVIHNQIIHHVFQWLDRQSVCVL